MMTNRRIIMLLCWFALSLEACARIPAVPPEAPRGPATSIPTALETSYPYPLPSDREDRQDQPDGRDTILLPIIAGPPASLPQEGPWLLFLANGTLSVLGLAGGEPVSLAADLYAGPPDLATTIAPSGHHLAFLTASDSQFHNLTLHIVSLPDAATVQTIRLTSPDTEPGLDAAPGETGFEITRAISSLDNLAWSPDGRQVAFTGAQSGQTAALYAYDLDTDLVRQLSGEPGHAIQPIWSPDGRYILYSGVNSLGTGAGFDMAGVWAVPQDGSDPRALDWPANSGDERHLGWASPDTALRYSFSPVCGFNNLRGINIISGQVQVLWAGAFQAIGFDPNSKKALFSAAPIDENCNPSGIQGMILTHLEAPDARLVSEQNAFEIAWSAGAGQFLAATPVGVVAIDPFGRQTTLPGAFDRVPSFAPAGDYHVWAQTDFQGIPGIWLGESATVPQQIFSGSASSPLWDPINPQLYFFSDEGFFKTDLANSPVLIAPGILATDAVIIQPNP